VKYFVHLTFNDSLIH